MSKTNDTDPYEAGLIAAMRALDALSETYLAEARANNMATVGEDNYNADLDTRLTYRATGAADAYAVIAGMVSDYRYRKASA